MEEAYEIRIEEVLSDDCRWAVDYYANLDESDHDRSVNIVVRTGPLGLPRTGRSHCLLDIGHRGIDHGLRLIVVGCLISIGRPRGDNLVSSLTIR